MREIVSAKLHVRPNCAARTVVADIRPIVEIAQRTGMQLEVAAFIGSSPLRQYAEGWTLDFLERSTEEALSFARQGRPDRLLRDRRHAPRGSRRRCGCSTRRRCGPAPRASAWPTRSATRRPTAPARWCGSRCGCSTSSARTTSAWTGTGTTTAGWRWSTASPPARPAPPALHGTGLGVGERTGNAPMDLLLVNLALLGYRPADLAKLPAYCQAVSDATGVPIPTKYPVVGRDAFRTATGVHAAAIAKAARKGDRDASTPSTPACLPRSWDASSRSRSARSRASGT